MAHGAGLVRSVCQCSYLVVTEHSLQIRTYIFGSILVAVTYVEIGATSRKQIYNLAMILG